MQAELLYMCLLQLHSLSAFAVQYAMPPAKCLLHQEMWSSCITSPYQCAVLLGVEINVGMAPH
jgi:hypothetical protein